MRSAVDRVQASERDSAWSSREAGGSGEECGLCTSLHALASSLPASILAVASGMAVYISNEVASNVSRKKHSDFLESSQYVSTCQNQ
jgi:hypothetical protein